MSNTKRALVIKNDEIFEEIKQMLNPNDYEILYLDDNSEASKTILVVEDNLDLLAAIKRKLELSGFSVIAVVSAQQALDYLQQPNKVDIVWLDHYLSDEQTGLDFMKEMKNITRGKKDMLTIVVSSEDTLENRQLYNAFGITRYYAKASSRLDNIIKDIEQFLEA